MTPHVALTAEQHMKKYTQAEDHMLLLKVMSAELRERLYSLKNIQFLEDAGLPHADAHLVHQTLLLEITATRTQVLSLITKL